MKITDDHISLSKIYDKLHDDFSIEEIKIVKKAFGLNVDELKLFGLKEDCKFKIEIHTKILKKADTKYSIIKIVEISILRRQQSLADFAIEYWFDFKDLDYFETETTGLKINPFVDEFLNHIVIATTRGVVYEEVRGTYLDKIILPLTKPSNLNRE